MTVYGPWIPGDDYVVRAAPLSTTRLQRKHIIATHFPVPVTASPDNAMLKAVTGAPGEFVSEFDALDGAVVGQYGGELDPFAHTRVHYGLGDVDGGDASYDSMWRRPPRVFHRPSPPSPSTIVPADWPDGAITYELDGTFAFESAVLEAEIDRYYQAQYVPPTTDTDPFFLTPTGGAWTELVIVDNASAVWSSPSVFDYYDPGEGGQSGGDVLASWAGLQESDITTSAEHDATEFLDENGNLVIYLSADVDEGPTVDFASLPSSGDLRLWWGGAFNPLLTKLRYTYAAPSYRWVYESTADLPRLRKYPTASLRKWPPEQFTGSSLRKIGSYP